MVSKERFDLLTEYAKLTSNYYNQRIEKALATFDFDSLKKADEMYKNKNSYDANKWIELYNTHKTDYSLLMPIITFGGNKLPQYVFEEILQNIVEAASLREPPSLASSKYNTYEKEIAFECIKHPLSDVAINTLFDILSVNALISRYYDIDSYSAAEKVSQIPDSNTNIVALKCAREYALEKTNSYSNRPLQRLSPVLWVKDIEVLDDILYSRTGYEQNCIASAIISSRVLNENDIEVQNLFSDILSFCDPVILDRYPDCITEDLSFLMYSQLQDHLSPDNFRICDYKSVDPITGKEKNEFMNYYDMLNVIENLCKKEKIEHSVEVDLANRIIDAKIREENGKNYSKIIT